MKKVAAAVGAGFLLGFLDFVWIKFVPFPFGALGNSSAVWAVAAFLFAYRLRSAWVSVVLLVVAVPSYYLAATLIQGDDLANVWSPVWTLFAVIAGCVFGAAGVLAHRADRWGTAAVAVPVAVLFAEAGMVAARLGNPDYATADVLGQASIEVVLGVLVAFAGGRRLLALALAIPFALVGFLLFHGAGFA